MIVRFFVIIALMLLIFWGLNSIAKKYTLSPKQSRLLLLTGVVLTAIVVLIAIGRLPIHFIVAPIGVALTFLLRMLPHALRLMPLWQMLKSRGHLNRNRKPRSDNRSSVITTAFLSMELQHSTGDMDGTVLAGQFEGRRLSSMTVEQLVQLTGECRVDHDSIQVLEAYLDRMHPGWCDEAQERAQQSAGMEETEMSKQLALDILGLNGEATNEEVVAAHRKLMQKLHPDRGGNDYLAKKINTAKDYLMEHL